MPAIKARTMHTKNWFNSCRYGMFIHWGPYSAAGRGEWIMNRERITKQEYQERYVENWKAENYDPAQWCQLALDAGMGYVVLTTRHHDGFALWDSLANDFNAARLGPKRDLLLPYVESVRNAGLKVGFYYSPASWIHPDYPGPFFRDWPDENDWHDEAARLRFIAYYRQELCELMSNYGTIDYLWFDGCIPGNLEGPETLAMIRDLQPDILINNRLGNPYDIQCSEQNINPAQAGQDWEACMTLNDNWGYHAGDTNWKTSRDVIEMLLTCSQNAGNLLLNIGPHSDGRVPEESVKILCEAGAWLRQNRKAVIHSERHPFSWNCTARPITAHGNKVYLHFMHDPKGYFCWAEVKNHVRSIRILSTGQQLNFRQEGERLFIENLPTPLPDILATTVELELDGQPEALIKQTTFWIPE